MLYILITNGLTRLIAGRNILAAELHPAATSNRVDLTFDLELAANVPSAPYQPPAIVIVTPENGNLFRAGTDVPIVADVLDPDGDLSEVRILTDGKLLVRTNRGAFSAVFKGPALGEHRVSLEAEDPFGHLTRMESVFTVVSNLVPAVEITSPNGESFPAGSSVALNAGATDPDGKIKQVAFFVRQHLRFDSPQILVGVDQTAPFQAQATGLSPGRYMVFAAATDDEGAVGYSLTGHFTIEPPAGRPDIAIRFDARSLVTLLEWEKPDVLLEKSAKITGPWQSIPDAGSPYPVLPAGSSEFYRLRLLDHAH